MSYIYRLKREHNIINLQNDMNMKPKSLLAIAFCLFVVAASAHANIPFRFATRAEAQMLITDIDEYTRGWNQFDINVRLNTDQGRKSKLLAFARKKLAEHPRPFLKVLDCNRRAIALYLRMGYRPAGVGCVYDPAVDPNATVFCREIKFIYGTKNSG